MWFSRQFISFINNNYASKDKYLTAEILVTLIKYQLKNEYQLCNNLIPKHMYAHIFWLWSFNSMDFYGPNRE
jgi:hypothetical protein